MKPINHHRGEHVASSQRQGRGPSQDDDRGQQSRRSQAVHHKASPEVEKEESIEHLICFAHCRRAGQPAGLTASGFSSSKIRASGLHERHAPRIGLEAYLADLAQRGMVTSSHARKLSSLRYFFKFLHTEETIDENPAERLGGPKRERPLPKTLTVAEVDHLLTTARARSGMAGENRRSALRFYCLFEVL